MTLAFKRGARVPADVTPEQILAELDDIQERYGRKSPEVAAAAVLKEPDRFPALRSFCPASAEEAFRESVRRAITYAVRIIVEVSDVPGESAQVRVLHIVTDDDGEPEYQDLRFIASDERRRLELFASLESDCHAFSVKQRDVLAEIKRLIGG